MKVNDKERMLVSLLNQYEEHKAKAKKQIDDLWKNRFDPNFFKERVDFYKNDDIREFGDPNPPNATIEDYYHNEYLRRIESFLNFMDERINHAEALVKNQPEVSSYSEAFGVLEALSFNMYY